MQLSKVLAPASVVVGGLLLYLGVYNVQDPPGFYAFAATECSPAGDCSQYLGPVIFSGLSIVLGVCLIVGAIVLARTRPNDTT